MTIPPVIRSLFFDKKGTPTIKVDYYDYTHNQSGYISVDCGELKLIYNAYCYYDELYAEFKKASSNTEKKLWAQILNRHIKFYQLFE